MLTPTKLIDFLVGRPCNPKNLPFVHTTESSRLAQILSKKQILCRDCNVFRGEKLCYLFVARPAYKYDVPGGEAPYWMLPTVFVVRFQNTPSFKRIYPFDSGAFSRNRLPDYITTFAREDFELGNNIIVANTLIETFFGNEMRYWKRQTASESDFRDRLKLTALDMQIEALNRLYGERTNDFDDRAACIEAQLDRDLQLNPADILGVVVPEEYVRDQHFEQELKSLTPNVLTYAIHPVSVEAYYSQIYSEVKRIYDIFGLLK